LGKERYDVPRLKGKTEDEAQDALKDLKLEYDESIPRYSEKVPKGQVIGTNPRAGTTLKPGASVDLIVSRGRKPLQVGDWVGKDAANAIAELKDRGLKPQVSKEYSDTVPEGDVIDQDPTGGTRYRGDEVALTVSLGPELIQVPSVRVLSTDAAVQRLTDLGFKVDIEHEFNYLGLDLAVRTDPGSGELAEHGSTITLYVI
jgi:serine/threonine-protein kinase